MNEFSPDASPPVSPVPDRRGPRPSRRTLRWLVPVAAVGIVAALASGVLSADAKGNLAPRSAVQLLSDVSDARVAGFSGTVVEKSSLGLPDLSALGSSSDSLGMVGLLSGSHTARVWYAGPSKQRVALLESLGEQDVFRDGRDVWQWDSSQRTATHSLLPATAAAQPAPSLVPAAAAQQLLTLIEPSTNVTTDHTGSVAGRSTYTLVLVPKDARSRVGSVRVALDGKTKVPLSVQVFARGQDRAALDISFTRVDFAVPDDSNFTFRPASDVKVTETPKPTGVVGHAQTAEQRALTSTGTGWTSVVEVNAASSPAAAAKLISQAGAVLGNLKEVSGSWGKGKLLDTPLFTALLTDQGKVYVGAVDPELLYQAAAGK